MAEPTIPEIMGGTLQAMPIDQLISAPLLATINAQIQQSKAYIDFVKTVGIDDNGKAVLVDFEVDSSLTAVGQPGQTLKMRVPLLALVTHPNVNIETVEVDFDVTVEVSESRQSETAGDVALAAQMGWGPISVKVSGKASHKSAQTRSTDTRAKYSFKVTAGRAGPPEGMMRVLDAMVDYATRPLPAPTNTPPLADA